uniref:non-specific serine/threonine protein kinase n=1 Tax=Leersia perrieri TaxID=77586 RepID=A0A0D9UYJ2_9ORYZ
MEWPRRLRIALGAAKGLAYLHEDCHPKIIHRDIKAANILLDARFEAKNMICYIKILSLIILLLTNRYLAPEYASSGKLTEKSDVFSFGVMLLELITGRRPVRSHQSQMDDSLVDWARPLMIRASEDGNYDPLVDPRLGQEYNGNEMARMIACAAACVRHSARRRPRMSQVVRALEGDVSLDDLNEGVRPGHSRFLGSYSSNEYDTGHYNEDLKKFRKMAFGSGGLDSGQHTPTIEFGQNHSVSIGDGHQMPETEMGNVKKDGDDNGAGDSHAS